MATDGESIAIDLFVYGFTNMQYADTDDKTPERRHGTEGRAPPARCAGGPMLTHRTVCRERPPAPTPESGVRARPRAQVG
jgi:hypothetical protein